MGLYWRTNGTINEISLPRLALGAAALAAASFCAGLYITQRSFEKYVQSPLEEKIRKYETSFDQWAELVPELGVRFKTLFANIPDTTARINEAGNYLADQVALRKKYEQEWNECRGRVKSEDYYAECEIAKKALADLRIRLGIAISPILEPILNARGGPEENAGEEEAATPVLAAVPAAAPVTFATPVPAKLEPPQPSSARNGRGRFGRTRTVGYSRSTPAIRPRREYYCSELEAGLAEDSSDYLKGVLHTATSHQRIRVAGGDAFSYFLLKRLCPTMVGNEETVGLFEALLKQAYLEERLYPDSPRLDVEFYRGQPRFVGR